MSHQNAAGEVVLELRNRGFLKFKRDPGAVGWYRLNSEEILELSGACHWHIYQSTESVPRAVEIKALTELIRHARNVVRLDGCAPGICSKPRSHIKRGQFWFNDSEVK